MEKTPEPPAANGRGLRATLVVGAFLLAASMAAAHDGVPLDRHGCHKDLSVSDYHCHEGPFAGRHFENKSEMLNALDPKQARKGASAAPPREQYRHVTSAIDVRTLVLEGGENVRLIGVDPPEPEDAYEAARDGVDYVRYLLGHGLVRLEFDPAFAAKSHRDNFGHTLAYAYLPGDQLLNRLIIRRGYARAVDRGDYALRAELQAAENRARHEGLGVWSQRSE